MSIDPRTLAGAMGVGASAVAWTKRSWANRNHGILKKSRSKLVLDDGDANEESLTDLILSVTGGALRSRSIDLARATKGPGAEAATGADIALIYRDASTGVRHLVLLQAKNVTHGANLNHDVTKEQIGQLKQLRANTTIAVSSFVLVYVDGTAAPWASPCWCIGNVRPSPSHVRLNRPSGTVWPRAEQWFNGNYAIDHLHSTNAAIAIPIDAFDSSADFKALDAGHLAQSFPWELISLRLSNPNTGARWEQIPAEATATPSSAVREAELPIDEVLAGLLAQRSEQRPERESEHDLFVLAVGEAEE